MNKVELEDKLKNILDYFESKGFQSQVEIDYEILFFSKIENDTKKCLQIEFREINNKIRLGSSINEYIQIDKVEDILKNVTNIVTHYKYTISSVYGVEKGGYMLDDYFWIIKEKDVDDYIEKLDVYYKSHSSIF